MAMRGIRARSPPTPIAASWRSRSGVIGFMAVEVTVGVIASSPALLSDAAHMLTDATAIGVSLIAIRLAQRPAKGAMTFGLKRTEILSAWGYDLNGL
jgi:cation diffusion facilitator family transporter